MSLTTLISDPRSPVRYWMSNHFPDVRDALTDMRDSLPDMTGKTIPAPGHASSTAGVALDYRLRFYWGHVHLDELVAWQGATMAATAQGHALLKGYRPSRDGELLAWPKAASLAPAAFFAALARFLERHPPAKRQLPVPEELRLARYCYVLGLYEEVFRIGYVWPTSFLGSLPAEAAAKEVLAIVPDERVRDIARMSRACYEPLQDFFERPIVLNPTFEGSIYVGGADGDLILDHRLVEIKTTLDARLDQNWLLQLLGYVLLDWDDKYGIDGLGLLLARQATLARWPLDRVLTSVGAGGMRDLPALRADFKSRLVTS
jgi:hypothetical protein